jgi:hypothetical protein
VTVVRLLPLIAAVGLLALFGSVGSAKAPLPARAVPCDEIIDATAFPYLGGNERANRYRLVLGAVSVPPAYLPQTVPTNATPWTYWRKAGLVVRDGAGPVTITVPRAWRTRAAIQWGYGGRGGPFSSLRIGPCGSDASSGSTYAGGFLLSSRSACVPLVVRLGARTATVRFGVGRRCTG